MGPIPPRDIWDRDALIRRDGCPVCESSDLREIAVRHDGLPVVECPACRLAFVNPRPSHEQLQRYYRDGYFSGQKDFFAGQDYCQARDCSVKNKTVTGYAEIVSQIKLAGARILDIGCGSGALLQLMKSHGPARLVGLDTAQRPVDFGRARYGLDLRCTSLEHAAFPDRAFDVVLMVDLIEHVENLIGFLRDVGRIVDLGGWLFLLTPNYAARAYTRDRWVGLTKDFEHLQYFSPRGLQTVLPRFGFRLVRWWTNGLPVAPAPYPKLHRWHAHCVFHPDVSLSNLWSACRYAPLPFVRPDSGHNLMAVLHRSVA